MEFSKLNKSNNSFGTHFIFWGTGLQCPRRSKGRNCMKWTDRKGSEKESYLLLSPRGGDNNENSPRLGAFLLTSERISPSQPFKRYYHLPLTDELREAQRNHVINLGLDLGSERCLQKSKNNIGYMMNVNLGSKLKSDFASWEVWPWESYLSFANSSLHLRKEASGISL